jgi:hypothetical protein
MDRTISVESGHQMFSVSPSVIMSDGWMVFPFSTACMETPPLVADEVKIDTRLDTIVSVCMVSIASDIVAADTVRVSFAFSDKYPVSMVVFGRLCV